MQKSPAAEAAKPKWRTLCDKYAIKLCGRLQGTLSERLSSCKSQDLHAARTTTDSRACDVQAHITSAAGPTTAQQEPQQAATQHASASQPQRGQVRVRI